jgi:hypothetical protein
MKLLSAAILAIVSAAAGAAATLYAIRKREELEQYDYDFDDDEDFFEGTSGEAPSVKSQSEEFSFGTENE